MPAEQTDVDGTFRDQVVEVMKTALPRLLESNETITEDMLLMDQLGLSSTLGLELLLQLEDQLDILINVEQMGGSDLRTVGDLATFVVGHSQPA